MDKKIILAVIIIIAAILVIGGYYYFILAPQKIVPVGLNLNEKPNVSGTNMPAVALPSQGIPTGTPTADLIPIVNAPVPPMPQDILKNYQVQISNFTFIPADLNIKVGDTVKWTNDDQPVHAIASANFASSNLNTGDTYSFTFSQAGSYDYHCAIHPFMTGKIIVSQ